MAAIDILILIVAGVAVAMGFSRGIIGQIGQIAGVIGGIIASRIFGGQLAGFFAGSEPPSAIDSLAGYVVVFLIAYFAVWLVARMLRGTVRAVHMGIVDRLAGAGFKAALWLLMLSMVLNFYIIVGGDDDSFHDASAPWRGAVVKFAPAALGYLAEVANNHTSEGV